MRLRFLPPLPLLILALAASAPVFAVATGDFNNDQDVNVSDAILVLRSAVGLQPSTPEQIGRADLSANGKLDAGDAVGILQIGVGLRPKVVVPNPLQVTAHPDSGHSVSGVITAAGGGSLTATGADGSKFTLTFPRNALLSDERITLTPVSSIDGLPLSGGLTAAVQLAPEGLRLLKAITLTIQPANAPPPGEQVGFAFEGQGKEYHRYPLELRASPITMSLFHFSGYGVGKGTDSSGHVPTSPEAQARQALADEVKGARGQEAYPTATLSAAEKILRDWRLASVAPGLAAAETDSGKLDGGTAEFLSWWRNVELLGLSDRLHDEIEAGFDSVARGLNHGIDAAAGICTDQDDPTQAPRVVRWAKTASLLGLGGRGGLDFEAAFAKVQECARFQLSFYSVMQVTPVETGNLETRLGALVLLHLTEDSLFALTGESMLDYTSVEFVPAVGGCTETVTPTVESGQMTVISMAINLNLKEDMASPEIALEFSPFTMQDRPLEQLTLSCPGDPSPRNIFTHAWASGFGQLHADEMDPVAEPAAYTVRGWNAGEGTTYARKIYDRNGTEGGIKATELTTLTLIHAPIK